MKTGIFYIFFERQSRGENEDVWQTVHFKKKKSVTVAGSDFLSRKLDLHIYRFAAKTIVIYKIQFLEFVSCLYTNRKQF